MSGEEDESDSVGSAPGIFWAMMVSVPNIVSATVDFTWSVVSGGGEFTWSIGGVSCLVSSIMDTLNTLLLGWLFSAILILVLLKFMYDRYLRGDDEDISGGALSSSHQVNNKSTVANDPQVDNVTAVESVRRVPTIVPQVDPKGGPKGSTAVPQGSVGFAAGQDADAVRWINAVTKWMYRGPHTAIAGPYLALLNDMTAQTALEVSIL